MQKLGYTVEEAANVLGIGRTAMFEKLASGEVESVRIGRRRIVPADALTRFLDRLRAEQGNGRPAA